MRIRAMAMAVLLAAAGLAPAAVADPYTNSNADANANAGVNKPKDLVRELLDMSAPAPDWRQFVKVIPWGQAPPDDAPIEVLLAFWSDGAYTFSLSCPLRPSAGVQSRLLEAVIEKPRRFTSYECLLPELDHPAQRQPAPPDVRAPAQLGLSWR